MLILVPKLKTGAEIGTETNIAPAGTVDMCVMGRDGIPRKRGVYPMRSMTRNYWRIMMSPGIGMHATGGVFNAGGAVFRSNGTTTDPSNSTAANRIYMVAAFAGNNRGLRLGTDDTPVQVNDNNLGSRIEHGSGAGQLMHLASSPTATDMSLTATRAFENISGGLINIRELGLFAQSTADPDSENHPFMFARDVLPEVFPLPNSEIATATITMAVTEGNRNMHRMLQRMTQYINWSADFYNTGGTVTQEIANFRDVKATIGTSSRGIVLGTGDTPVDRNQIDLGGRILHGTDPGRLTYFPVTDNVATTATTTQIDWQLQRQITNNSGADIIVREMGLFSWSNPNSYLLDRFVLPNPVTFAAGETRVVRWLFRYSLV